MTTEEIKAKVIEALSDYSEEPNPQMNLRSDLDMDSLDRVEFAMNLEREFNIIIPDSELIEINTVQEAIDCVAKHLATLPNV